ncbi:enoyl-CoA hydratase/isomerase family protein [Sphingosinicella sp. CPCC 101087]|uniref:enoyl-CoA hydratase/isomerase family protein n=1 Tax=Sphingosinicella sp. CPCC 101087 TaxID=2497754 RepID=UPI0013EC8252|nr:enoyl-CoA hydratase/isomerase family protein [Sphingosinicella sp. CPCC 101087]
MFGLKIDGAIARLTLDRPQARNAIPAAGWAELAHRIGEAAGSDVRILVLSGEGGTFCAGADLGDFAAMRDDEAAPTAFRRAMRTALDALRDLQVPTVAAIDGACFGAGVALAMACDLRIAAPDARFAITPAKIGLSYPQEDVHRLVALVGPGQAARLLFTAETIDAGEANAIGLVERVAPPGGAEAIVAAISANAKESLAALKRGIRLAGEGRASDAEQDRRFDAIIASDELARRLEALRRK